MNYNLIVAMLMTVNQMLDDGPVNQLPAVTVVSPDEVERVCQRSCSAAYLRPTIYLSSALDLTSSVDQGILFHELVHHYQEVKQRFGPRATCERFNRREFEAYELQNRWYQENQVNRHVVPIPMRCDHERPIQIPQNSPSSLESRKERRRHRQR